MHGFLFFAALLGTLPAAPDADIPNRAQVQAALNALERCRGLTGPECPSPLREYRVHDARCMRIAPEEGRATVACRVDLSLIYPDPERNTRHRDNCARFVRRDDTGDGPDWAVVHIRDRPCEMQSLLARDPNPEPDRRQLARALVAMLTCYDTDGITDCGPQPTTAVVEAARCRPIPPGAEGRARAACRVTGRVNFSSGRGPQRLRDICIRLDRFTPADESPAVWSAIYVPEGVRCEVR